MTNRDSLINKLNALRAKANKAGTPEEAIAFMDGYNKLMKKYKLTETDLEVKSSKVENTIKSPAKNISMIERICNRIAALTETRVIKGPKGQIIFLGLGADIQYADWLYNLVENSLTNGLRALPMTALYHRLLNNNVKPNVIQHNFQIGFLATIAQALDKMIEENKVAGNALVLLKSAIIQTFLDENGGTKEGTNKAVKVYDGAHEMLVKGHEDAKKVRLRKDVESVVKGYLN